MSETKKERKPRKERSAEKKALLKYIRSRPVAYNLVKEGDKKRKKSLKDPDEYKRQLEAWMSNSDMYNKYLARVEKRKSKWKKRGRKPSDKNYVPKPKKGSLSKEEYKAKIEEWKEKHPESFKIYSDRLANARTRRQNMKNMKGHEQPAPSSNPDLLAAINNAISVL